MLGGTGDGDGFVAEVSKQGALVAVA